MVKFENSKIFLSFAVVLVVLWHNRDETAAQMDNTGQSNIVMSRGQGFVTAPIGVPRPCVFYTRSPPLRLCAVPLRRVPEQTVLQHPGDSAASQTTRVETTLERTAPGLLGLGPVDGCLCLNLSLDYRPRLVARASDPPGFDVGSGRCDVVRSTVGHP